MLKSELRPHHNIHHVNEFYNDNDIKNHNQMASEQKHKITVQRSEIVNRNHIISQ